jgi:hypothetical protein
MDGKATGALFAVLVLLVILAGWLALTAPAAATAGAEGPDGQPPELRRERGDGAAAPNISFITSPSATCYRPEPRSASCLITWAYLQVNASPPNYIISMTVTIDGRLVAAHWGFFQHSMTVSPELYNGGFRVPCGVAGAAGNYGLGGVHSYALRARETGGLGAANYGTVTCPTGMATVFLPLTLRD